MCTLENNSECLNFMQPFADSLFLVLNQVLSFSLSGFLLPKLKKKNETEKFVFYAVAFDPIKIQTCLASQNDGQQLGF